MANSAHFSIEANQHGEDPQKLLIEAGKTNQILGIGECHIGNPGQRPLIADILPQLKAEGYTDFFFESDAVGQPTVDEMERTGQLQSRVPLNWLVRSDSYVDLLEAARNAGMRLHAIDSDLDFKRDQTMATRIENILGQHPGAKGIYYVGANHVKRGEYDLDNHTYTSAGTVLREDGWRMFATAEAKPMCQDEYTLGDAQQISRPEAFSTQRTPDLAAQPFGGGHLSDWDAIIAMPGNGEGNIDLAHTNSYDNDVKVIMDNYLSSNSKSLVTSLNLRDNFIDDNALAQLKQLPNLKVVDLRQTLVTAQGVEQLQKDMPNLRIISDFQLKK